MVKPISPQKALFIKLGSGGEWEEESLRKEHRLRLGFNKADHKACMKGDWEKVRKDLLAGGKTKGKATEITNELRHFYESDGGTLWVTFSGNRMWWAFAEPGVERLPDGSKVRRVNGKWVCSDVSGMPLSLEKISGQFSQVRNFRGTICSVDLEYATNKINALQPAIVVQAKTALAAMEESLIPLIRSLHWKDFELLIDLIFSNAGWQRISVLGKTQKTLDLDLRSPVTGERVMVQVKSTATLADFSQCYGEFSRSADFNRLFFVVHSPSRDLSRSRTKDRAVIWCAPEIVQMAISAGLIEWLLEKNS